MVGASWAAALKAAYYPHLRALSLDNCNGGSRPCKALPAASCSGTAFDLAETAPATGSRRTVSSATLEDHHSGNRETTNNQKQ